MNDFLNELYKENNNFQDDLCKKIISKIKDLGNKKDFNSINDMLISINLKTSSNLIILSLARSSYLYRSELPEWKNFVLKAKEYFEIHSNEVTHYLKGLN